MVRMNAKRRAAPKGRGGSSGFGNPRNDGRITEQQHDDAVRVLRAEYYQAVRSIAQDVASRVKEGEDENDVIHEEVDGSCTKETMMAKPIPYDDDPAPESDERDMRKIVLYDDEALKLMQGWTGGQDDPLYAISSTGGWNYAWVFESAIANIDRDLRSVKKLGRNKFQLGRGTFSKKEIDELRYIRDALAMALEDPESVMVDEVHSPHVVRDFNTLDDLIQHAARDLGATHTSGSDAHTKIYFPRGGQHPYEEATVWRKGGYWHAQGPGARTGVSGLPAGAKPIGGHAGRRAAEAPRAGSRYSSKQNPDKALIDDVFLDSLWIGYVAGPFRAHSGAKDYWQWRWDGLQISQTHPFGKNSISGRAKTRQAAVNAVISADKQHRGRERQPELRETRSVQDYIAVDRRGRTIAGPFKSYSDAKHAAGTAGVVQFVRPGASEARRAPTTASRRIQPTKGFTSTEQADAAGQRAAVVQLQSEHFDDWVYGQLVESREMEKRDPDSVIPLKTADDARKIARNMLQELEWDMKRQGAAQEELGSEATRDEIEAFYKGAHKALQESVPWLADTLLAMSREIRGASEVRRPKAKRSARRKRR